MINIPSKRGKTIGTEQQVRLNIRSIATHRVRREEQNGKGGSSDKIWFKFFVEL